MDEIRSHSRARGSGSTSSEESSLDLEEYGSNRSFRTSLSPSSLQPHATGGPHCESSAAYFSWPCRIKDDAEERANYFANLQKTVLPESNCPLPEGQRANTLLELMTIRAFHSKILCCYSLGTAIGFRIRRGLLTNIPAILVFVSRKVHKQWLTPLQCLPTALEGPGGIWCDVDVVEFSYFGVPEPTPKEQLYTEIVDDLRGSDPCIGSGSQVANQETYGTLGAIVRSQTGSRQVGFLTNHHVAVDLDCSNQKMFHPLPPTLGPGVYLGAVERATSFIRDDLWFGIFAGINPETFVRADGAFIPFTDDFDMTSVTTFVKGIGEIGNVKTIDLQSPIDSLVGKQVTKVGRSSGLTTGTVLAYALEYNDEKGICFLTDFLVVGENQQTFDLEGDSGSLIIMKGENGEKVRPIGIIWGGTANRGRLKLKVGQPPENWTSGVDLGRLLNLLELDLITTDESLREPTLSHPQKISKASGGNIGGNLLYDVEAKDLSSISNKNTMIKDDAADSQETYFEELREKIEKASDGDASISSYETSKRGKIEEAVTEAKPEVSVNEVLDIKRYLDDFILFCLVLPHYYEFTMDILVSQWIIGGLIELGEDKMTEEVCMKCFDTLVERDYFVPSEYDYVFYQMKYKIGDGKKIDSKVSYTSEVEHVSLAFKELGFLNKYSCLRTLVIYNSYGVDHLPSDIFLELKTLKILNLSGTNVAVLPASFENLKELRFFDMSKTPIRWLPETISYFSHLHTLNLDGCLKLECLPKYTNKLINLQHLVVDVSRLSSMPIGMGNLSNLQTLNVFSVGVDDGRRVTELKDLNKLRGSFSLLNLENVRSKEEALEACLYKKVRLRKIELHWSDIQDEKCIYEEEILESLQPPLGTQELKILFYSGGVLPSWIGNPSFSELVSIALDECKYCSSLPTLGELPSLKSLSIIENNVMTEIGRSFFGKRADRNRVAFPKLEKLSFDSMSKLEKWSGFEDGDFPSLRLLIIEYCPELVGLSFLSCLSSLSGLEIRYCPEFSCLLEDGLPPSLESLMIKQSPKLKAQCCDEQWSKVAFVPSIYIDDQEVFPKNSE